MKTKHELSRTLIDSYEKLCLNTISQKEHYQLIADITNLLEYDVTIYTETYPHHIDTTRSLINSHDIKKVNNGIHYFMQLCHGGDLSFGAYILISFGITSIDDFCLKEDIVNEINKDLRQMLNKLNPSSVEKA